MRTSKWTQACPGWRGDLGAYLVGALDPHACAAVRRHLGICAACEAEYEDLVPVVSCLALLTPARLALRQHAVTAWKAQAVATPGAASSPGQASEPPAANPAREWRRRLQTLAGWRTAKRVAVQPTMPSRTRVR